MALLALGGSVGMLGSCSPDTRRKGAVPFGRARLGLLVCAPDVPLHGCQLCPCFVSHHTLSMMLLLGRREAVFYDEVAFRRVHRA